MSIIIKPLCIAKNIVSGACSIITNHDVVFFVFKQTLCASASGACMGSAIALTHYGYIIAGASFYSLGALIFIVACVLAFRFIVGRAHPPKKEPVVVARITATDTVTETVRIRALPLHNRFPDVATEHTALGRIDLSETPRHRMYMQPDADQFVIDRLASLDPSAQGYDEVDSPRMAAPARMQPPSRTLVDAMNYFEKSMLASGREVVFEISRTATRATSVDRTFSDERLIVEGGMAFFRVFGNNIRRMFNFSSSGYDAPAMEFYIKLDDKKEKEARRLAIEGK